MIDIIIVLLFGFHRYRIKFIYKNNIGDVVFYCTGCVGVVRQSMIEDHRAMKVNHGPIYYTNGIPKHLLSNGTLEIEPICYLGRWK